jgi:hypothetical protein
MALLVDSSTSLKLFLRSMDNSYKRFILLSHYTQCHNERISLVRMHAPSLILSRIDQVLVERDGLLLMTATMAMHPKILSQVRNMQGVNARETYGVVKLFRHKYGKVIVVRWGLGRRETALGAMHVYLDINKPAFALTTAAAASFPPPHILDILFFF